MHNASQLFTCCMDLTYQTYAAYGTNCLGSSPTLSNQVTWGLLLSYSPHSPIRSRGAYFRASSPCCPIRSCGAYLRVPPHDVQSNHVGLSMLFNQVMWGLLPGSSPCCPIKSCEVYLWVPPQTVQSNHVGLTYGFLHTLSNQIMWGLLTGSSLHCLVRSCVTYLHVPLHAVQSDYNHILIRVYNKRLATSFKNIQGHTVRSKDIFSVVEPKF